MPVLTRRSSEDLRRGDVIPFTLEAGAAHLAEEQITQDDECPCPHVGARLEALSSRPRFQQRFLDEIVGEVAAAGQRPAKCAQVRNDLAQLILELVIGQRHRLRPVYFAFMIVLAWLALNETLLRQRLSAQGLRAEGLVIGMQESRGRRSSLEPYNRKRHE